MAKPDIKLPKPRYEQFEFDKLKMYFRKPYIIDLKDTIGSVTVYQPTIGKIVDIGEKRFYSTLNIFIANTTLYRAFLWDIGIDWNIMTDFEMWMFFMFSKNNGKRIIDIDDDVIKLLFGDLNFDTFDIYERDISFVDDTNEKKIKKEKFLYSEEFNVEITEETYQRFHQYLQKIFNMKPEEKFTPDDLLKDWFITQARNESEIEEEKRQKGKDSSILSLISACVNHPGFKYNVEQLEKVGVYQFFDSVNRLQIYENATATLRGIMSGLALSGGKGVSPDEYNIMREI